MSKVESQMLPLGTEAPEFLLPDADGQRHGLRDEANAHLVMFICNHCPFVKHVADELAKLGQDYLPRGIAIYAINSNDADTHPGDSPEQMKEEIQSRGYGFPYLIDSDQSVAKKYLAACTPDFFLFDKDKQLVYRGQLDNSRPGNGIRVSGDHLRAALDAVLNNSAVAEHQIPSVGCNIKWKAGSEPGYFS